MKKFVLLTAAVSLTSVAFGQNASSSLIDEYECIYEYQVKNTKGSIDATSTILQIGRNTAKFSDYTTFQARHKKRETICSSTSLFPKMNLKVS